MTKKTLHRFILCLLSVVIAAGTLPVGSLLVGTPGAYAAAPSWSTPIDVIRTAGETQAPAIASNSSDIPFVVADDRAGNSGNGRAGRP